MSKSSCRTSRVYSHPYKLERRSNKTSQHPKKNRKNKTNKDRKEKKKSTRHQKYREKRTTGKQQTIHSRFTLKQQSPSCHFGFLYLLHKSTYKTPLKYSSCKTGKDPNPSNTNPNENKRRSNVEVTHLVSNSISSKASFQPPVSSSSLQLSPPLS